MKSKASLVFRPSTYHPHVSAGKKNENGSTYQALRINKPCMYNCYTTAEHHISKWLQLPSRRHHPNTKTMVLCCRPGRALVMCDFEHPPQQWCWFITCCTRSKTGKKNVLPRKPRASRSWKILDSWATLLTNPTWCFVIVFARLFPKNQNLAPLLGLRQTLASAKDFSVTLGVHEDQPSFFCLRKHSKDFE